MVAEDGKIHGPEGAGSPESTTTHQRTYDNEVPEEVNLRDASVQEVVDLLEEMGYGQETLAIVVGKELDGKVLVNALGDPDKEGKSSKDLRRAQNEHTRRSQDHRDRASVVRAKAGDASEARRRSNEAYARPKGRVLPQDAKANPGEQAHQPTIPNVRCRHEHVDSHTQ